MAEYSIIRLSCVHDYPAYKEFLASLDDPKAMSYSDLLAAYNQRKICYSSGFIVAMGQLGNRAFEILIDFEVLQKKWAEENGVSYGVDTWMDDILIAQIKHFSPDVLYSDRFFALPKALLHDRPSFPSLRVLAAQQGFPMGFAELRHADIVFSCARSIARVFCTNGINAVHSYHSFDPAVLADLPVETKSDLEHDFVFSGHSGYGFDWHHRTRYNHLRSLLADTPLQAWVTERDRTLFPHLETPIRELFPEKTHAPVYGMDMYSLLHNAKVCFNMNPDSVFGYSGIMREFEATGVGCCMLTNHSLDIARIFEPDSEVVTYTCLDDCREKLAWLLGHEEERHAIGQRAKQRVAREHLVEHRVQGIHENITTLLG